MKKTLFIFDTETSGLDPDRNSILQIAWLLVRDGMVLTEKCYDAHPLDNEEMNLQALEINGFELPRIRNAKPLTYVLSCLVLDLQMHVFGSTLAYPCGHNVNFDISFLLAKCKRLNHNLYGYIDFKRPVDTRTILTWMDYNGHISLENYKLETVCDRFKIPLKAHDALEDSRAVSKLFIHLKG